MPGKKFSKGSQRRAWRILTSDLNLFGGISSEIWIETGDRARLADLCPDDNTAGVRVGPVALDLRLSVVCLVCFPFAAFLDAVEDPLGGISDLEAFGLTAKVKGDGGTLTWGFVGVVRVLEGWSIERC